MKKKFDGTQGVQKIRKAAQAGDKEAQEKMKEIQQKISTTIKQNNAKKRAEVAIFDDIQQKLFDSGAYSTLIDKVVKDSTKSGSYAYKRMVDTMFGDDFIKKLDAERDKLIARDKEFIEYRILKRHFKEQIIALTDPSFYKFYSGGRRSGKTKALAGEFVKQAIEPNSPMVYIHRKFASAIKQMWDEVINLSSAVELNIKSSSKVNGIIEWENGSTLMFIGNNDINSFDSLRGHNFILIIIDEAGFQRNLKYGINEVIKPLMLDHPNSKLILSSTPPRAPHHYSEVLHNMDQYKKFHWTYRDNSFLPENKEEFIQDILKETGQGKDSTYYRREYEGEWGVYDTESQVFKVRTYATDLTFQPNEVILGMDYGERDYNAIVVLAYNKNEKKAHVVYEDKFNKSNLTELEERLKKAIDKANSIADFYKIDKTRITTYVDTDQPIISNELSSKGFRVYPAYKYDKQFAIDGLADFMRTGKLTIIKDGLCDKEAETFLYERDETTDAIIQGKFDEESGEHPDILMALLYAFRQFSWECGYDFGGSVKNKEIRYSTNRIQNAT